MLFLFVNNPKIEFAKLGKLTWRSYDIAEALPTTCQIELMNKREFTKVAINENSETFVIYVVALKVKSTIHPSRAIQIITLQQDKAPTKVPTKYSNYANVFSSDLAIELPKNSGMYEHDIELIDSKTISLQVYLCPKPSRVEEFENLY